MASELTRAPAYRHTIDRLEAARRITPEGAEYWTGRDIHPILGYPVWDKFLPVVQKAWDSMTASGEDPSHHIAETSKLMIVGKGAKRRVGEFILSRAACYLIAMNGESNKPEIAGAQHYFTIQTRKAELAVAESKDRHRLRTRERVSSAAKRVSDAAKNAGVKSFHFFHGARYHGMYELPMREIEKMKGLHAGENLLDRAGSLELAAHSLQMELAATKITSENINGERRAIDANREVGRAVRKTIFDQSGVKLEDLPLEAEPIGAVRKRLTGRVRLIADR